MVPNKKVFLSCSWHHIWIALWFCFWQVLIYPQIYAPPGFFLFFSLPLFFNFLESLEFFCLFFFKLLHFLDNILGNYIATFRWYISSFSYYELIGLDQPDTVKWVLEKVNLKAHQVKTVNFLEVVSNLVTNLKTVVYRILFAELCITSAELGKIEFYFTIERMLLPDFRLSWFHWVETWRHEFECVVFSEAFLADWSYRYALYFLPESLLGLWIDTEFCEWRQKWQLFLWHNFVVVFALKLFFVSVTMLES